MTDHYKIACNAIVYGKFYEISIMIPKSQRIYPN